eukprot:341601-Prorocentrum_minimum.AAC.1
MVRANSIRRIPRHTLRPRIVKEPPRPPKTENGGSRDLSDLSDLSDLMTHLGARRLADSELE